jgi:hypothetical protein
MASQTTPEAGSGALLCLFFSLRNQEELNIRNSELNIRTCQN